MRSILPSPLSLLGLLALASVWQFAFGTYGDQSSPEVDTLVLSAELESETEGEAVLLSLPDVPEVDIGVITARPLFTETRRPLDIRPEPAAPAPVAVAEPQRPPEQPKPAPPKPEIKLLGTMQNGNDWAALVGLVRQGEERWMQGGDAIDGWTIDEIASSQLQMRYEDEVFTIFIEP